MTDADLKPENVDKLPEKYPPLKYVYLPYRRGHFHDPEGTVGAFGVRAYDTEGKEWLVCENKDGVYKKQKKGGQ